MKILDRYILKSFVITFATVFVILFFIFILQTVWLFIAELAGKDLDVFLIVKFLMFAMPRIIPLVLPLSVLLASIMTFGSFAENYEFAAMKSSGISLQRAMRSLMVFIGLLSIASFFFANNVIPYAEYQFINFRSDIAKKQPAMAIAEGQFSDIGTYNIKVDKKSGENGNQLTGVTIHRKSVANQEAPTVIRSKTGELVTSEDSNVLKLVLKDGDYYEDVTPSKMEEKKKLPFAKSSFKRYVINMDLSKLNKMDESDDKVTTNNMLNVSELSYTLDSLHKDFDKNIVSFADNIYQRTGIVSNANQFAPKNKVDSASVKKELPKDLLSQFSPTDKSALLKIASSNVESTNFTIESSVFEMQDSIKNINNHQLAFFDKFVIAYACILMFFIGAPLGAIIRKGGVGLPIVFAVLIFITFHFINTFGKKMAQSDGIPAWLGAWMSSFILTPFAVLLTYRASNDISITISFDWLIDPIQKIFAKRDKAPKVSNPDDHIINLESLNFEDKPDWEEMNELPDSSLTGIVKNAKQFGYSQDKRLIALKILENRGISQHDLLRDGNLLNHTYDEVKESAEYYASLSKAAFVFCIVGLGIGIFATTPNGKKLLVAVLALVNMVFFYISLYKSEQELKKIGKLTNKDLGINIYLVLLTGMPIYLFYYFYNRAQIKRVLSDTNF